MENIVQIRLEDDFVWEPVLKRYEFNEDAIKIFCKAHPEYYTRGVELNKYHELRIDVRDENKKIKKYDVYVDEFYNFYIKEVEQLVL